MGRSKEPETQRERNNTLFDKWSIIHFVTSALFALIVGPKIALIVVFLWEPIEIYVLSPLLKKMDVNFGDETLKNSISDLFFDTIGVVFGYLLLEKTFLEQLVYF